MNTLNVKCEAKHEGICRDWSSAPRPSWKFYAQMSAFGKNLDRPALAVSGLSSDGRSRPRACENAEVA